MQFNSCINLRIHHNIISLNNEHLLLIYMNKIYWDDIAIFCHPEEFDLTIYEMNKLDIKEIDNLDELILLDNSYLKYKKEGKNEK